MLLFPAGARDFYLLQNIQNGSKAPLGGGLKRSGSDVDHSPPPDAEVKNNWSYTPYMAS